MITIHDVEQGTDEWLALRENLYTGNGAEKLLRHNGQIKLVNGVASAYALSEITGFTGNFYTRRGHALEDEAVELYEQIQEVKVNRAGFLTNSKYPTCGYSPDGLAQLKVDGVEIEATINGEAIIGELLEGVLLEVKCFDIEHHMVLVNAKKIEDIPLKILAQIHFGLLMTGLPQAHLVAYNPAKGEDGKPLLPVEHQLRIITIKARPQVRANFRRILAPGKVAV